MTCFTTFRIPSSHDSLAHSLPTVSSKRVRYNPVRFFPGACERRVLLIVGVCKHFSHPHILSSSSPLIFTFFRLDNFSSSHLFIFTSSQVHIFSSSHIFPSFHLHILTSSHLFILTSSHPHTLTSSHLLIFTSPHLHIFPSSHLHILTFSHLHIFSSSHHIFSSSHLHILFCSLTLLLSPSFLFLSGRRGAVPTRRHEMQPLRTK